MIKRINELLKYRRLIQIYREAIDDPESIMKSCPPRGRLGREFYIDFWKSCYNTAVDRYNERRFWFMSKFDKVEIRKWN